jgi:hypothetical protein
LDAPQRGLQSLSAGDEALGGLNKAKCLAGNDGNDETDG